MVQHVTMEHKEPIEIDVNIYQLTVDGLDIDFSADVDNDGDIIIDLEEDSFEEVAVKYLRERNDDEQLRDMFGIEEKSND